MTETPEQRAAQYLIRKAEGLTYREIGEELGVSAEAVRNVIRRYNEKVNGIYSGVSTLPANDPYYKYRELTSSEDTYTQEFKAPKANRPKVLIFDIETVPGQALYFSPKTRYIPMTHMIEDGRLICFAAKWLDGPMMFSSEWDHGREKMIQHLWSLLDEADIIVGYNSDNFDIAWCNSEFVKLGLGRPTPYKSVDLIKTVRKHFRFMYNKLDFLAQQLLDSAKEDTGGISLWRDILFVGSDEAKNTFRVYNKKDVMLTEDLYKFLLPWIDGHPPMNMDADGTTCRVCGSDDMKRAGWKTAVMMRYPQYKCQNCGAYGRTTSGGERISNVHGI